MSRVFKFLSVAAPAMSLWWFAHSLSSQHHNKQHSNDHHDQQHQHHDQEHHHPPQNQEQQQQPHQHNHEHSNGVDGHSHEPVEKRSRWMKTASQALMGWQSFNSDNSAHTSVSSASLEMLLNERQSDPEQMLLSLGFGGESPGYVSALTRVPVRFLQQPSMAHGINIPGVEEEDDGDNDDDDAEEEEEEDNRGRPREESYAAGRKTPGRTGRRKPGGFYLDGVLYWSRCGYLGVWALLRRGVPLYFFNEEGSQCYNSFQPKVSAAGGTGENRRRRRKRRGWSQNRQAEGDATGDVRGEGQEWKEDGGRIFDVGDEGMGWRGEMGRENAEEWSGVRYDGAVSQAPNIGDLDGGAVRFTDHNDIICPPTETLTTDGEALPHSEIGRDFKGNGSSEIPPTSSHIIPGSSFIDSSPISSASTSFAQASTTEMISEPEPNLSQTLAPRYSNAVTNSTQIESRVTAGLTHQDSLGDSVKEGHDVDFLTLAETSMSEVLLEDDSQTEDVPVLRLSAKEDGEEPVSKEVSDPHVQRDTPVTSGGDQSGQTKRTDRSSAERKSQRKQDYDLKQLTSAVQEQVSRVKNVAKNFMSRFHGADDTDPQRTGQKRLEPSQKGQEPGVSFATDARGRGGSSVSLAPGQRGQGSGSSSGPRHVGQRSGLSLGPGQRGQESNPRSGSGQKNQGPPQRYGVSQRGQGLRPKKVKSGGAVADKTLREKRKSLDKYPTPEERSQKTTQAQEAVGECDANTDKMSVSSPSDNSAQRSGAGTEDGDRLDKGDNSCAVTYVYDVVSSLPVQEGVSSGGVEARSEEVERVRATGVEVARRDVNVERDKETARNTLPTGREGAGPVDKNDVWTENDDLEWCYDGESLDLNQVIVKPVSSQSSPVVSAGLVGPTDSVGLMGPTDSVGLVGPTDSVGLVGPMDSVGLVGPTDSVGLVGPMDSVGLVVPTDSVGLVGPTTSVGLLGHTGSVGLVGPTDSVGLVGPTASVGLVGPTDSVGLVGPTDSVGLVGPTDSVGLLGPTDSVGLLGHTDSVGLLGHTGSVRSVCWTSDPVTVQTRVRGTTLVSSQQGLAPKGADQSKLEGRTFKQISEPKQVQQRVVTVRTHAPGSSASVLSTGDSRMTVNFAESDREHVTTTSPSRVCVGGGGDVVGKVGHVITFTVPGPHSKTPLAGDSTGIRMQVGLKEETVSGTGRAGKDGRDDGPSGGQKRENYSTGGGGRGEKEEGGGGGRTDVIPPADPSETGVSSLRKEARSFLSSVLASRQAAELSGSRSATSSHLPRPQKPPPYTLSTQKPTPHTPSPHTPSPHTPSPHAPFPHTASPHTSSPHSQQPPIQATPPVITQLTSPLKRFSLDGAVVVSPLQSQNADACAKGQGPNRDHEGQGREPYPKGQGRYPAGTRKFRWAQSVRVPHHPMIPPGAAVVRRRISTGSVGGNPPISTSSSVSSFSSSSASFFSVKMTSRSADEFTRLTAKDFEEPDLTNVSSSSEEEEETEGEEEEKRRRSSVLFSLAKGESLV